MSTDAAEAIAGMMPVKLVGDVERRNRPWILYSISLYVWSRRRQGMSRMPVLKGKLRSTFSLFARNISINEIAWIEQVTSDNTINLMLVTSNNWNAE